MFFDFLVNVPNETGKISLNRRKGVVYVEYTYGRKYIPEKKYNIPQRTTIGKLCETDETKMYPNPNYLKFLPDAELPQETDRSRRSGCIRIGAYLVIRKIVQEYGLEELLQKIIGKETGLFLDLAAYSIITENNAGQYYPDYGYGHALFTEQMKICSDAKVSDFLSQMERDAGVRFLNEWNSRKDHREKIYISYDSTNKTCQAGEIELAEYGHTKEGAAGEMINYAVAYDRNNREPLFYEDYPGSIVDVAQLQVMLEKAKGYGYRNIGFILDRGYFSKPNVRYMDRNGFDFVIMVKGLKKLVRELVLSQRGSFEDVRKNAIRRYKVYGTTVKGRLYASDQKDRYFHLYYSSLRHAAEQEELETKIDRQKKSLRKVLGKAKTMDHSYEHYFTPIYYHEGKEDQVLQGIMEKSDVIEEEVRLCGYFCIITSKQMSAEEALGLYKSRDGSEKLFRADKSYLGNAALRVQTQEAAEAKILIGFVALIIRNRMYTRLKDAVMEDDSKANYMNVPAAVRELEKIEMIRQSDGTYVMDHAVTATQKTILKAFQIDSLQVQKEAARIRDVLKI